MKIRTEHPQDYQAIAEVNTLAFEENDEAELVERIRESDRYIQQLSLIAEIDNLIVAHLMLS